jgi:NhaP-type Na+/H+ or K+/H+ antiporter
VAVFAAIGALSHEHERAFSASLIYLGLGVCAAVATTVLGLPWLDPEGDAEVLERITELAVVFALFSAGLKLDRALSWRSWASVVRLLTIAMPLTIGALALFGTQALGLSLGTAIVLGAALAPTDPVLAGDIGVGPPGDEEEREPNFALTAEAGLNDGLAFPFVLLGLFVASGQDGWQLEWALADGLWGILGGIAIGAAAGTLTAWSIVRLRDRELLAPALDGWVAVAATLAIYGVAEVASTYGFLAAFAGGLAFRRYEHGHEVHRRVHDGAEIVEKLGELAVILLLGSLLSLEGLGEPGVAGWLLALLLLLAIRPLAVNLAFVGSRLERPGERAFVAWFGVRGVGSLYYVAAAVAAGSPIPEGERDVLVWTTIACVLLSIVLHGVTAAPISRRLGMLGAPGAEADVDEPVTPPPSRAPATPRAR